MVGMSCFCVLQQEKGLDSLCLATKSAGIQSKPSVRRPYENLCVGCVFNVTSKNGGYFQIACMFFFVSKLLTDFDDYFCWCKYRE